MDDNSGMPEKPSASSIKQRFIVFERVSAGHFRVLGLLRKLLRAEIFIKYATI